MSRMIVFAGPTLERQEAPPHLKADWKPPVGMGDVLRAVRAGAEVIGIIDGYFNQQPAVWHKEILYAISRGVAVYGAASMGALRAAELEPFGMIGVGKIYRDFAEGRLEDDDEVAIAHAPASLGYRPLSDAMVDIRYTLHAAVDAGVLSRQAADQLAEIAKSRYFPQRSFRALIQEAPKQGLAPSMLQAFQQWLPEGQIHQKRLDALELLHRMASHPEQPKGRKPDFRLSKTVYWERLLQHCQTEMEAGRALEELYLLGGVPYHSALRDTRLRVLGLAEARRRGLEAGPALEQMKASFYQAHRIRDPASRDRWSKRNQTMPADLDRLVEEEALVRLVMASLEHQVKAALPDQLRSSRAYEGLWRRAREKRHILSLLPESTLPPDKGTLLKWYFDKLGREIPSDLQSWARSCGFADQAAFIEALQREYLFVTAQSRRT